jgi:hypothetical protein
MMSGPLASATSSDADSSSSMDSRMSSAEASAARVSWGRDAKDFHLLDKHVSAALYCYYLSA